MASARMWAPLTPIGGGWGLEQCGGTNQKRMPFFPMATGHLRVAGLHVHSGKSAAVPRILCSLPCRTDARNKADSALCCLHAVASHLPAAPSRPSETLHACLAANVPSQARREKLFARSSADFLWRGNSGHRRRVTPN